MPNTLLLGLFDNVAVTAEVIEELRQQGVEDRQVTVISNVPYSHKILGRKHPRQWFLPFVLAGALGGLLIGLFIVVGTPYLYPIHVGGQPLTPFPPSVIIVGEFIALGSMVAAFFGFLLQNRFPIMRRQLYDSRITEGYIGVQVQADAVLADRAEEVFQAYQPVDVIRADADEYPSPGIRHLLFWGGAGTAALVAVLIPLLFTYDIIDVPWINVMFDSPAVEALEGPRRAAPDASVPIQGPVMIGDFPATERLPSTDDSIQRGQVLYNATCVMCHGAEGGGNGSLAQYFPEAPALTSERVVGLSDQEIFRVITRGLNRMPALAENLTTSETWDVVNYIRSLPPASE